MPTHTSAIIPRAKRNAAGEDISRAVVSSRQRRPESNTSSKAIVLRHGRHGIWGEGQIATFKKLSGQEKLALKADELRKTALSPPFRLAELMRMAQAEMGEALDLISDLHDPEFFYEDISTLIASRPRLKPDLLSAPFIAKTISSRVHNAYLLAASWKVVFNVLTGLKDGGLTDTDVRKHLKNRAPARDAYLLVIDTIEMLSNLAQQELSIAVVGSNELGGLFTGPKTSKGFSAVDAASVMSAHRSLIDAVIIELVLPDSRYEPHILIAVLRDALDTTPREEAKKFSQNVFDALGNFVALIEMKDMLVGQLYGKEGYEWLKMPRKEAAGEIDEFFDAINQSLKASGLYSRWQNWAYPLKKTKSQAQLDDLWKQINTVYIDETGQSIDSLWQLENERKPNPQWSTWYIPEFAAYGGDIPSDSESKPFSLPGTRQRRKKEKTALVRSKKRFRDPDGPRPRKAIMNEEEDDGEYDGMPGLMSVSESSDDEGDPGTDSDSDEEDQDEEEEDDESEWEGIENSKMNAMLTEAMREYKRRGGKVPLWTEESESPEGDKDFNPNIRTNPFMKMLRSFAGRMFNPDPTFRPPKMGEKPVYGPPRPPPATSPAPTAKKPAPAGAQQASAAPKAPGMTVEDADDEEDGNAEDKKKKKKKKKKPKKKTTAEESAEIKDEIDAVSPLQEFVTPTTSPTPAPTTPSNVKLPTASVKSPGGSAKSPSGAKSMDPHGHGASTISLPTSVAPSVAQSAHSYLVGKDTEPKVKVKTRADPSTVHKDGEDTKKKGFFSKFTAKKDKKEKVEGAKDEEANSGGAGVFGKKGALQLPKRAGALVGRLLGSKDDETKGKAPMRWDNFVKAMNLLGFKENNGSQGSRVTFYPPDPKDKPMVIHKPHPNPTISPVLLKTIGKRLRDNYGWAPEHFESRLGADAAYFDDDLD